MPYADPTSEAARASEKRRRDRTYAKHREKIIARKAKYAKDNSERVNARSVEWRSRNRAKAQGIEFTLSLEDVVVPELCPVLGIPLVIATGCAKDGSPSLDRIDPARGYVQGNVKVISHKANTIKSNATADEIRAVLAYVEAANGAH
jgi:hypothetical protein